MKSCWKRYVLMGVLGGGLTLALGGCGGGGGGGGTADTSGFKITGSVTLTDGSPNNGTTVRLHKTSYTIYSTATAAGKIYGTRNAAGAESVALDPNPLQTATVTNGAYAFSGVPSGNYTIVPSSAVYLFKSVSTPTLDRIGVLTITETGTAYFYNPEATGNQLTSDGKIIYNASPVTLTGSVLPDQDFEASLPGGSSN